MREQYRSEDFTSLLSPDPMDQFARLAPGRRGRRPPRAQRDGRLHRDPGRPPLLAYGPARGKQYDDRDFVFFTNYGSRKGRELAANPYVSLLFPGTRWPAR
ncbi:Pyridoxine/pyridoxamine 5'-phosphate oxidase OS=Streptomyces microflavus OX=1919 GN=pdxH PE=3 SV=1 [Streptomyces microflavus]